MKNRATRPGASLGALLAAALVMLAACTPSLPSARPATSGPSATGPGPSAAVETPPPTPGASPGSVAEPCDLDDLKASHGQVEGAAGSRFTTVELVAAVGCAIDAFPAMGLRDAHGAILVGAAAAGPGRLDLHAGTTYESNVRLGNWCADEPAFPLDLEVRIGSGELAVTGGAFANAGDLPPCNGTGGPILEATGWVVSAS
jgi:hypothetical protein